MSFVNFLNFRWYFLDWKIFQIEVFEKVKHKLWHFETSFKGGLCPIWGGKSVPTAVRGRAARHFLLLTRRSALLA